MSILAIDLGGTKLAAALFARDGAIRQRATFPLEGRQGRDVGALILEAVARFRQHGPIRSVGVAVPGIYRSAGGTVWAPNIPGWDEWVPVGVFARPEPGRTILSKPLYLEMHRIRSGDQTITIDVPERPLTAGIDPFHVLDWEELEEDDNREWIRQP